jgi:hypothetical protein
VLIHVLRKALIDGFEAHQQESQSTEQANLGKQVGDGNRYGGGSQWGYGVSLHERLDALISDGTLGVCERLAVDFENIIAQVDDPVFGNTSTSVQSGFAVAV